MSSISSIIVRDSKLAHNKGSGIHQFRHGQTALDGMTITGNRICGNGSGISMTDEGHTITDNNVGAGTTGCLPNTGNTGRGYDLYDEVAASSPVWGSGVCPSTWRNNYTEGDTFNHPCVTK